MNSWLENIITPTRFSQYIYWLPSISLVNYTAVQDQACMTYDAKSSRERLNNRASTALDISLRYSDLVSGE